MVAVQVAVQIADPEDVVTAIHDHWQQRFTRLCDNAMAIRAKLQGNTISPGKRAKLEWQLRHLGEVVMPRFFRQQPF